MSSHTDLKSILVNRKFRGALLVLFGTVATGSFVWAQIGQGTLIHGCVGPSGVIRGIDETTGVCRNNETLVSWYSENGADATFSRISTAFTPVYFADEFDRPNSSEVSNGWMELEQSPSDLTIVNGQLRMSGSPGGRFNIKSHGLLAMPYSIRTRVTPGTTTAPRATRLMVESSGLGHEGLGVGVAFVAGTTSHPNHGNLILKNGPDDSSNTNADLTVPFYIWVDVRPSAVDSSNVDLALYYSTSDVKPQAPLLTAFNVPHGRGADVSMVSDWVAAGDYFDVDYLFIESLDPTN